MARSSLLGRLTLALAYAAFVAFAWLAAACLAAAKWCQRSRGEAE